MSRPSPKAAAEGVSAAADIRKELQARIARITGPERLEGPAPGPGWAFGLPELDGHLPAAGLSPKGLHELAPASWPDMPAAIGFAASLAARRCLTSPRPVLWLSGTGRTGEFGRLYGHGLKGLGLSRQQLITARLRKPADLLWALEEALKAKSLGLVIAEVPAAAADLTLSRRLSLAAAAGATPALLLAERPFHGGTAALTRWQVKTLPSRPPEYDPLSPGAPSWALSLTRCRGGKPGEWHVEWHHAAHCFHLVPRLQPEPPAGRLPQAGTGIPEPSRPALRLSGSRA